MVKSCTNLTLVAGRTRTNQKELPKMPVPPLKQTFELYLSVLESIVKNEELKHTKELVEEFLKAGGVGERLQRGLERRAHNTVNWSTDDYLKNDLLDNRKPVVVRSNFGILFTRKDIEKKHDQIRCAAEFIASILDIKTKIDNNTLPVDNMEGQPLCMKQYEQVISSCRIPGLKTDSLLFNAKSSNPPKHISVVHNCQFFVLNVYNSDGTPLTVEQLCVQLDRICNSSPETNLESVGILTTQQRDIWSKAYFNVVLDKTNRESLSAIQSSIFIVCLDRAMTPVLDEIMYRKSGILQMLHGGGSHWNSGNRWFDKGLQVIIGEDGTWGINSSHATADGSVLMNMCDHVVANMKNPQMMQSAVKDLPVPQKLHFNITPQIKKDIEDAKQHIDTMVQNLDLRVMVFDHFGKNFIKAKKMSPDAFLQMALQLAYYRIHQQCCATMEPASLRMFRLGRVAVIHSNSMASAAFVKAFDDPKKQDLEKVDLLEKAIKEHRRQTKMVIHGQAIGIHLLGLMLQAVGENMSVPGIFTETSYAKAFDFQLSTSQIGQKVTSKTGCLPCIGPEEPGIYDVSYSIMDNHIDCTVSCLEPSNACERKNPTIFINAMKDALLDMRTLLEHTLTVKL
ncbi:carnitine O-acetyltransferase-like [Channa argus]|uniref:carnitine O-acetyltransferase-like n=1 Tax=Channa argus TaxID=215402 RepID=UPI003521BEDE